MLEDESLDFSIGAFDTDSFDENLEFSIVANPSSGTLDTRRAIASYTYTPNENFNGQDSFVISVTDGIDSSEATVTCLLYTSDAADE